MDLLLEPFYLNYTVNNAPQKSLFGLAADYCLALG